MFSQVTHTNIMCNMQLHFGFNNSSSGSHSKVLLLFFPLLLFLSVSLGAALHNVPSNTNHVDLEYLSLRLQPGCLVSDVCCFFFPGGKTPREVLVTSELFVTSQGAD